MSRIISSVGLVKATLIIVLNRLKDDGTIENLNYETNNTSKYEIIAVSERDGMLYTLTGIITGFGACCEHCDPYRADYITLDNSTLNQRKVTNVLIKNIRAIQEIEQFS